MRRATLVVLITFFLTTPCFADSHRDDDLLPSNSGSYAPSANQDVSHRTTAAQGFMNSVGGFLGNVAKIAGPAAAGLSAATTGQNCQTPTYYIPSQNNYISTNAIASSSRSGIGSNRVYPGSLISNQNTTAPTSLSNNSNRVTYPNGYWSESQRESGGGYAVHDSAGRNYHVDANGRASGDLGGN